ncbi:hypothetical protein GCM10025734_18500 [Kitasatospora paranensis]
MCAGDTRAIRPALPAAPSLRGMTTAAGRCPFVGTGARGGQLRSRRTGTDHIGSNLMKVRKSGQNSGPTNGPGAAELGTTGVPDHFGPHPAVTGLLWLLALRAWPSNLGGLSTPLERPVKPGDIGPGDPVRTHRYQPLPLTTESLL